MVLALQTTAMINRFMRATMLDNLNQDYVRTARAKGLSEWTVVMIHVLRNSMIPVITVIALNVPAIFGGCLLYTSPSPRDRSLSRMPSYA